jgi:hypothetical protein
MTTLADLAGKHVFLIVPKDIRHPLVADASGILFVLDDTTYLVFEDPNDGYRSMAGPVLSYQGSGYELGYDGYDFPTYIREAVTCTHRTTGRDEFEDGADILEVRSDATGEIIFEVGTDNVGDYYPSYACRWNPAGLSANAKQEAAA